MSALRGSLRVRLTAALVAALTLLTALVGAGAYALARRHLIAEETAQLVARQRDGAHALEAVIEDLRREAEELATAIALVDPDRAQVEAMLQARLVAAPELAGVLVALEPGRRAGGSAGLALHLSRRGTSLRLHDFVADDYPFRDQGWYRRTLAAATGWWSGVYFSESAGGQDVVTYNRPLRAPDGTALGMVSLDFALESLLPLAERLGLTAGRPEPVAAIVDADGRLLHFRDPDFARAWTVADAAQARHDPALARLAEPATRPRLETVRGAAREPTVVIVTPVAGVQWRLATFAPHGVLLADLDRAARWLALAAIGLLAALAALAWAVTARVARPLVALADAAGHIADGAFDHPLPATRGDDEVGVLVRAFDRARGAVREGLARLARADDARRRIEGELDLARSIQLAMVPKDRLFIGPALQVTVVGRLEPARAVGGDFYGVIALDASRACVWVGDVSDKGVPSALFMARVTTVLGGSARLGGDPGAVLARAAAQIHVENETGLFATVLLGILDLDSGELALASAGHDPPLLRHPDGRHDWIALDTGPAIGFEDGGDYPVVRVTLTGGERLVAYTDGITEAFDPDHEAYGSERLAVALERHASRTPGALAAAIIEDVHRHARGAEQSDDITLLLLAAEARG